jgi:AcrR family transcriptional regulator
VNLYVEVKSIQDITVRELSDLVDINRATFYLHYKNVFDMVEQIENEMIENFHIGFLDSLTKSSFLYV